MGINNRASLDGPIFLIDPFLFFVPPVAVMAVYVLLARQAWFPRFVEGSTVRASDRKIGQYLLGTIPSGKFKLFTICV